MLFAPNAELTVIPSTPTSFFALWKRIFFCGLGLVFVGLGYLGAILPGLPTTPFLLAASWCFLRSSPRLHAWLHRMPWVGAVLRDWEQHRAIRRSIKIVSLSTMLVVVSCSLIFTNLEFRFKCIIAVCAFIGATVICWIPTRKEDAAPSSPAK